MAKNKSNKQSEPNEGSKKDSLEERVRKIMEPGDYSEENLTEKEDKTPEELSKAIDASADSVAKTAPEVDTSKISINSTGEQKNKPKEQKNTDEAQDEEGHQEPEEDTNNEQTANLEDNAGQGPEDNTSGETADNNKEESSAQSVSIDDNPDTDRAVEDILREESDEILKTAGKKSKTEEPDKKPGFKQKLKNFWAAWWGNKTARRASIGIVLLAVILSISLPVSRYTLLNFLGVRSRASIAVTDESTTQPLKNVEVTLGSQTMVTNENGEAFFEQLKLGTQDFVIKRRAFAEINSSITIGWGSNPLGNYSIKPVGSQYAFQINDFLSGQPVHKAEVISGNASAFSDENGLAKLTLDQEDIGDEIAVEIISAGYRTEKLEFAADKSGTQAIDLAPAKKHVFVSKRSGTYDVYSVYADGESEELLLKGTGNERDDLVLAPNAPGDLVAYVSTRDGERNKDGFLLSTLSIIQLGNKNLTPVAQSERIQVVGWVEGRLVYVRVASGTSGSNPERHRLMSYNPETGANKELAATNYFNDVFSINGLIYYAPSSAYQTEPAGFYQVKADGEDSQKLLEGETWNILRKSYEELILASAGNKWRNLNLLSKQVGPEEGPPADFTSRIYMDSPDQSRSLWVEQRDGKGTLLLYSLKSKEDIVVTQQSGLKNPVRWLNNTTVVFRVQTPQETADYIISIEPNNLNESKKEPRKLIDVTDTGGVERWYYY